jgi:hypothetical protein
MVFTVAWVRGRRKGTDVTVDPWVSARHFETYQKWMHFYDVAVAETDKLPPTGFVVDGLAIAFLLRTDGPLAFIEGLVGNPWLPREQVDPALDAVVQAVIGCAREEGFRVLQGTTAFPAVVARALRLGFTLDPSPHQVVSLLLQSGGSG